MGLIGPGHSLAADSARAAVSRGRARGDDGRERQRCGRVACAIAPSGLVARARWRSAGCSRQETVPCELGPRAIRTARSAPPVQIPDDLSPPERERRVAPAGRRRARQLTDGDGRLPRVAAVVLRRLACRSAAARTTQQADAPAAPRASRRRPAAIASSTINHPAVCYAARARYTMTARSAVISLRSKGAPSMLARRNSRDPASRARQRVARDVRARRGLVAAQPAAGAREAPAPRRPHRDAAARESDGLPVDGAGRHHADHVARGRVQRRDVGRGSSACGSIAGR